VSLEAAPASTVPKTDAVTRIGVGAGLLGLSVFGTALLSLYRKDLSPLEKWGGFLALAAGGVGGTISLVTGITKYRQEKAADWVLKNYSVQIQETLLASLNAMENAVVHVVPPTVGQPFGSVTFDVLDTDTSSGTTKNYWRFIFGTGTPPAGATRIKRVVSVKDIEGQAPQATFITADGRNIGIRAWSSDKDQGQMSKGKYVLKPGSRTLYYITASDMEADANRWGEALGWLEVLKAIPGQSYTWVAGYNLPVSLVLFRDRTGYGQRAKRRWGNFWKEWGKLIIAIGVTIASVVITVFSIGAAAAAGAAASAGAINAALASAIASAAGTAAGNVAGIAQAAKYGVAVKKVHKQQVKAAKDIGIALENLARRASDPSFNENYTIEGIRIHARMG
jgi:hypothetical protein